ncbi:hypothetical protein DM2_2570 [Halorubrum sp. DM2]|nr:hypothetical protein DM2_2570 [Halorubrum sp. DM2]
MADPLGKQPGGDVERLPGAALDPLAPGNLLLLYHADPGRSARRVTYGSPIMW